MEKEKYKIIGIDHLFFEQKKINEIEFLDNLYSDGYELVSVIKNQSTLYTTYYFKLIK